MIRLNKELCVFSVFTIIEMAVIFENLLKLLKYFTQKVFVLILLRIKSISDDSYQYKHAPQHSLETYDNAFRQDIST